MQFVIVPILVNDSVVVVSDFSVFLNFSIEALIPATGTVALEHNSNLISFYTVVVFSVVFRNVKSVKLVPNYGRPTNDVLLIKKQLFEST